MAALAVVRDVRKSGVGEYIDVSEQEYVASVLEQGIPYYSYMETVALRYGQRVKVVALPAPALQTTPKGLEHVGPRAFGYDLDFRSVFAGDAS